MLPSFEIYHLINRFLLCNQLSLPYNLHGMIWGDAHFCTTVKRQINRGCDNAAPQWFSFVCQSWPIGSATKSASI